MNSKRKRCVIELEHFIQRGKNKPLPLPLSSVPQKKTSLRAQASHKDKAWARCPDCVLGVNTLQGWRHMDLHSFSNVCSQVRKAGTEQFNMKKQRNLTCKVVQSAVLLITRWCRCKPECCDDFAMNSPFLPRMCAFGNWTVFLSRK